MSHVRSSVQLPPGPRLPGALQLLGTWTRPGGTLERLRRMYGKRITVRLPFQPPLVILSDPEEIRELFAMAPEIIHPGEGASILEPIIGPNSVILLDEDPHLEQRRLLLPAFHGERMQRLAGLMRELTEQELSTWPLGTPFAVHAHLQRLTLEIILRAVFGLERGARLEELRDVVAGILQFSESPLSIMPWIRRRVRWLPTIRHFEALIARGDQLIYELIEERRRERDTERDDVLAMLLQARHQTEGSEGEGEPMSSQEIRDELMTALVAGHETTASQLAWALEQLARAPEVAERIAAEAEANEGERYLTATIQETMRLRPVLPNAEPRLTKQPVRLGESEYPRGVLLLASAYLVHRDEELYPEPNAFRPERFLEQPPGTYTWIPFGGGRRRCLGASFAMQEMKIVLREVLTRFQAVPAANTPEPTARRSITFSPKHGATIILRRRPGPGPDLAGVGGVAAAVAG